MFVKRVWMFEKLKEFEKVKEFEIKEFVDELKCENESLKMHAKCLIAKPISKKD